MANVFISYQTADRHIAGELARSLRAYGLVPFMAHEDIHVSDEWRATILRELNVADACVCLLSENYLQSVWCIQEAGIAAFKDDLVAIPLIIDQVSLPPGFLSAIQGKRCNPLAISIMDILPGLMLGRTSLGINVAITMIENSRSFRGAESNYELLLPRLGELNEDQARRLFTGILQNDQVLRAGLCAQVYIPRTLKLYGGLLTADIQQELVASCQRYGSDIRIEDIPA